LIDTYKEYAEELVNIYDARSGDVVVSPFDTQLPGFKIPLDNGFNIELRPVLTLPRIKPPSFRIKPTDAILQEFVIKACPCKPEPPWINRRDGLVQFTTDLQELTVEMT
jgi:hypothetical protein